MEAGTGDIEALNEYVLHPKGDAATAVTHKAT
jgi:hypothetical protein